MSCAAQSFEQPDNGGEKAYNRYRQPDPVELSLLVTPRDITNPNILGAVAAEVDAKVPKDKAKAAALRLSQHGKPDHA
jgi:hypothetical protein